MKNVSREMEIIRLNQKEILDIKNNVTVMKNASYGLSSRLDIAEERLSLRRSQFKPLKLESKENRDLKKKWDKICKNCGTTTRCVTYVHMKYQREKSKRFFKND